MIAISLPQVPEDLPVGNRKETIDSLAQIAHEFYVAKAPRVLQIGPHLERTDAARIPDPCQFPKATIARLQPA
jgi:hypothetical protein